MSKIKLGSDLPHKSVTTTHHDKLNIASLKGQTVVLYFYPRDNTPGCTTESKDFRDAYKKFQKLGAEIIGVSRDSIKSHMKFTEKFDLPFQLISDESEELCELFGVMIEKNMFAKIVFGIERSTFVFDQAGKLVKEWRKLKVPGHVDEVFEFVKAME